MNAKDIVSKEFDTVKRGGYDAAEVDTFLKDVSIEYKKMQNENEELEKKLEVLAEKIREYRKDEDALRDALLIAKKQGIAVVNEAKEDAEKIRKEAKEKADKTIKDADALAAKKKEISEKNLADANAKAKQIVDEANAKAERDPYNNDAADRKRTDRSPAHQKRSSGLHDQDPCRIQRSYREYQEYAQGLRKRVCYQHGKRG